MGGRGMGGIPSHMLKKKNMKKKRYYKSLGLPLKSLFLVERPGEYILADWELFFLFF